MRARLIAALAATAVLSVAVMGFAQDKGKHKLVCVRYDLEAQRWGGEATELKLPDEATAFTAVLNQRNADQQPPELAIQVPNGAIYYGQLNTDGSDWEQQDEWDPLVDASPGGGFALLAAVALDGDRFYLFARNITDNSLVFHEFDARLIVLPPDLPIGSGLLDRFRIDLRWRSLGIGEWLGAFRWPGTDQIYVFSQHDGTTQYQVVSPVTDPPQKSLSAVSQFDEWLRRVAGLSLDAITVNLAQSTVGITTRTAASKHLIKSLGPPSWIILPL